MAVQYISGDSAYSVGSSTTHSFSVTVPAGAKFMMIGIGRVGTAGVSSVLCGSDNGSAISGCSANDGTVRSDMWQILNPTSGVQTVTVTYASAQSERMTFVGFFKGVDVAGTPTANGAATAALGNPSANLTTVAGDMAIDYISMASAGTKNASQSDISADRAGTGSFIIEGGASYKLASTTSTNMAWTIGNYYVWVRCVLKQSVDPIYTQASFRFRNDDGALTEAA